MDLDMSVQDKRYIADVLLAAGATAAYVNMFT